MSYEIKTIIYASDLTSGSSAVFRHAVGLAEKLGAKLHAVTATPPMPSQFLIGHITKEKLEEISKESCKVKDEEFKKHLDRFAQEHPDYKVDEVLTSIKTYEGDAHKIVLQAAKDKNADMIVMGSRGHSPMGEMFIGSVASRVTMKAKIPVILVPIES